MIGIHADHPSGYFPISLRSSAHLYGFPDHFCVMEVVGVEGHPAHI
jgi:hypothetical protein